LAYQGDYLAKDAHVRGGNTALSTSETQDLTLNPVKSRKTCEGDVCTWRAHWYRDLDTGDDKDISFTDGVLSEYWLSGEVACGGKTTVTAEGSAFKILMGHTYPELDVVDDDQVSDLPIDGTLEEDTSVRNLAFATTFGVATLLSLL
jgi:hypothetical protein